MFPLLTAVKDQVIGVDAGATKTCAALVGRDGGLLAEVTLSGANPLLSGEAAYRTVAAACRDALAIAQSRWERIAFLFVGMSGVDEPESPSWKAAKKSLQAVIPVPFELDNDSYVAHQGAFGGADGVLTIAGTGAIVLALCQGRRYRVDGMGEWLGDEGSAAWITLQGLRAAVRGQDGRGRKTQLAQALPLALGVSCLREVVTLLSLGEISRQELAWVATKVQTFAEKGDQVAAEILREAGRRLAESAFVARARTGVRLPVSYSGGVFEHFPLTKETFCTTLQLQGVEVTDPMAPPHLGACLVAAKFAGWKVDPQWLRRLEEKRKAIESPSQKSDEILLSVLPRLISEQRNWATLDISRRSVDDILLLINEEDQKVAPAVRDEIPAIAQAVRWATAAILSGGRVFYVGAGTSGRLGVMDAAECPPTFGTPPQWFQGIMAGGYEALWKSVEGAEDDQEEGRKQIQKARLDGKDLVIGISMSGRTPFVLGAIEEARRRGARTVVLTVNRSSPLAQSCDLVIAPAVGPEVLAGSTRMKGGTATKLILNMLSTATMIRLGRVESNLMVGLKTWCGKLRERAKRIVSLIGGISLDDAERILSQNEWDVRRALNQLSRGPCQPDDGADG
ncbi:MAG: N-acetylmuramic acid 6-phosphate etherase [Armatimonadetes bacterium]|nr:N-acetylmuramic acid 6-phosphate etherase [Armatimonadota bacterium]MDW8122259.1 N-acetylmuramic acid 6-phosphate etherase [Armatimonadota bacterium]